MYYVDNIRNIKIKMLSFKESDQMLIVPEDENIE
jgi:hypothetical protein